ncbi:MAG: sulfatase-like hydrolase/transferase [Planctomycetota bacterium]
MRLALLVLSFAFAACGDDEVTKAPSRRPSVVLITLDTTRADHLGCYGYKEARTPAIDRVAQEGTLFTEARTCVPITLPAHASLLTGTLPPRHGIRDNGVASLSERATTLAERLREAGWTTGAFIGSYVLDATFRLDQGFDLYDDVPDRQLVSGGYFEERPANEVVDAALTWMATVSEEPFFLWVHLFDPHAPYAPPPPFDSEFAERPYDGEIAFADSQVMRLLETLATRRERAATFVIVTADHGEGLGEHNEDSHALFVYDSTLRIPLLITGPGIPPGLRVKTPVTLVDIAPTILDLLELPPLEDAQGSSLRPALSGEPIPATPIYFESYNGYLAYGWSPLLGVVDKETKVIDAPEPELYRVSSDRGELENAFARERAVGERLRAAARTYCSNLQAAGSLAQPREPSAIERSRLEGLGYVGPAAPLAASLPLPSSNLADPKEKIFIQQARVNVLNLLLRKELVMAEGLARQTLLEDPQNAYLWEYLGQALAMQGRFSEALEPLTKCVALRPDRHEARFTLAFSLYKLARLEEALAQARECLRYAPGWVKATRWIAMVEMERGNLAVARQCWQDVIDHWKGDPSVATEAARAIELIDSKLAAK